MGKDMIVIIDLGSRENDRLAQEIRDLGVYCEIHPHTITISELEALPNVKGVILNGGPDHIVDGIELDVSTEIYNASMPVLMVDHKGDDPWPENKEERIEALTNFVLFLCGANFE